MMINGKKTKTFTFNFTDNYQFNTRLKLNNEIVEVIDNTKLLGTVFQNNLGWDLNTRNIVKKANARMELLRQVASFGTSVDELKNIYFLYIRSLLEQSAVVWHSSLTQENVADLERVQKSAVKIILQDKYNFLDIPTLSERRDQLSLSFAKKCLKHPQTKDMFPLNKKSHNMETRNCEKYLVSNKMHNKQSS